MNPAGVDNLIECDVHIKIFRCLKLYGGVNTKNIPAAKVLMAGFRAMVFLLENQCSTKPIHSCLVFDDGCYGLFEVLTEAMTRFSHMNFLQLAAVALACELLSGLRTEACANRMAFGVAFDSAGIIEPAGIIDLICKAGVTAIQSLTGTRKEYGSVSKSMAEDGLVCVVTTLNALRGQCQRTLSRPDVPLPPGKLAFEDTPACIARFEQAVNAGALFIVGFYRDHLESYRGDGDESEVLTELRIVEQMLNVRKADSADAMAAELIAEEDAAKASSANRSKKKRQPKAIRPPPTAASGSSTARTPDATPDITSDVEVTTTDIGRAASDAALRAAVDSGNLDAISRALEAHRGCASEAEVARAVKLRDKLKDKRRKESQQQRRAHGQMMKEMCASEVQAREAPTAAPAVSAPAAPAVSAVNGPERVQEAQETEDASMVDGLFVPSLELVRSLTDSFSDALKIGTGGCAVVYQAISPAGRALAIKRAKFADAAALLELQEEVKLLRRCDHPHLLPLLGFCSDVEAPCLLFPLMTGGSLEQRLFPSDSNLRDLRRLGHCTAPPKPLTWRQRLRVLHQATEALLYLHRLTPALVHRDFKPANILLRADLHAMLSDTGFAKAAAGTDGGTHESIRFASITSRGVCHTTGYADPLITSGGGFSTKTDAYAVGVTLLVCLTGRAAVRGNDGIFDAIEEDHEQIFGEIEHRCGHSISNFANPLSSPTLSPLASLNSHTPLTPCSHTPLTPCSHPLTLSALADPSVGWPATVCSALVPLVLSTEKEPSLCNPKKFKRLPLSEAVDLIARLASAPVEPPTESATAMLGRLEIEPAASSAASASSSSEVSLLVREIGRKAACNDETTEQVLRLQQKASEGFKGLLARLDHVLDAAAPTGFEDRINFWHSRGAITGPLQDKLHKLRRWRNAAEHGDDERWRMEGPKSEGALMRLLSECDAAVTTTESSSKQ